MGTFPIRPVSMIPWLMNWINFWIESAEFFWNWIIFWIESWVKRYWIEYWMNHFLAKFKHWIESDWVSYTPIQTRMWDFYIKGFWADSLCVNIMISTRYMWFWIWCKNLFQVAQKNFVNLTSHARVQNKFHGKPL